jgi:two-component system, response regulator PdtaR
MHALIIEDESLIAMAIEDALRGCGFATFDFAGSMRDAIIAARHHCPDLVTSDVQLSPGCGIEAVETICAERPVPVVFITGTAAQVEERLGTHIVVHKPFAQEQISNAVRLAVGRVA